MNIKYAYSSVEASISPEDPPSLAPSGHGIGWSGVRGSQWPQSEANMHEKGDRERGGVIKTQGEGERETRVSGEREGNRRLISTSSSHARAPSACLCFRAVQLPLVPTLMPVDPCAPPPPPAGLSSSSSSSSSSLSGIPAPLQ